MPANVGHGHHQPVGADHHPAAAGDLDHRRPDLGHQRFDLLVNAFQLGQTCRAADLGRSLLGGGRPCHDDTARQQPCERQKKYGTLRDCAVG